MEEIISYIMETPENVNGNILREKLKDFQESSENTVQPSESSFDLNSLFNQSLTITNTLGANLSVRRLGVWGSGADAELSMISDSISSGASKTFRTIEQIICIDVSDGDGRVDVVATNSNNVKVYTGKSNGDVHNHLFAFTFNDNASLTVGAET